jgi:hypothetical protein
MTADARRWPGKFTCSSRIDQPESSEDYVLRVRTPWGACQPQALSSGFMSAGAKREGAGRNKLVAPWRGKLYPRKGRPARA